MPRRTRKNLADDASSRGRSRTPAQAAKASRTTSKTITATSSVSSSRSSERKAEVVIVESKQRSSSRSKAPAAAASTSQTTTRQSRSGSRNAPSKEKKMPAPTKRGREKAQKEESKEEKEEEEVKPKRARVQVESKGKSPAKAAVSPQRKAKPPVKADASVKSKAKSVKAAVSVRSKAKVPVKATSGSVRSRASVKASVVVKSKAKPPVKAAVSGKSKAKPPAKAAVSVKSKAKPTKAVVSTKRKAKPSAKAAASTSTARSSRRPKTTAAQKMNKKKEEPKKSTSRSRKAADPPSKATKTSRTSAAKVATGKKKAESKKSSPSSKGKPASASSNKSLSRRNQEAVESQEEERNEEEKETTESLTKQAEKAEDVKEEVSKVDDDIEMREEKEDVDSKEKEESELAASKESGISLAAEGTGVSTETDAKPVTDSERENGEQKEDMPAPEKAEVSPEADSKQGMDSAQEENFVADEAESLSEDKTLASVAETSSSPDSAAEPMEDDAQTTASSDNSNKNGNVDDQQSLPRSSVKRKFEEIAEEVENGLDVKQACLNGTGTEETPADVEMNDSKQSASEAEPSESDLLKDFVVVNKDDVPAPDSSEVAASVPAEVEEANPADENEEPMETEEEAGSSGTQPDFAVPLTQAEMIKASAYDNKNQVTESCDGDDVLSTIVEVGSLSGSEITGGITQHLDTSEVVSAASSCDDDCAEDSVVGDSVLIPAKSMESIEVAECEPIPSSTIASSTVKTADGDPNTGAVAQIELSSVSDPEDASHAPSAGGSEMSTDPDVGSLSTPDPSISQPFADVSANCDSDVVQEDNQTDAVDHLQNTSVIQPSVPASVETDTDLAQSPGPVTSVTRGNSIVTDSLGTPDPAFLATYSSPDIFNRAYVPNPTVPADSVVAANCFSVVSYNILAECNRLKADYSYTAEEFLCQEYRHGVLMKELQYLDGDVVCLQEVNPDYFNNTLLPDMKSLGYDGVMKRRMKEAFDEGEATFFKTDVFEMECTKSLSLTEVTFKEVERGALSADVGAAIKKYLDRADVVVITQLRCKASGKVLTIGNIHVVWDFSRCPDVQCIQIACAIKEVVTMASTEGAHMICGDFNSEWTTPAYQVAVDGYLTDSSITTLQGVANLELDQESKSLVNHLQKAFQHTSSTLRSAYSTVTKSEPEITSLTSFMESAVDYQFYSADSLVPVGVLKTVDQAVIKATGGLPSKDFPSDHVSMKSVMSFIK